MGALISVLLIWVVTGVLVYLAVLRVIQAQYEINATVMLITAAVGVVVNIMYVSFPNNVNNMYTSIFGEVGLLSTDYNITMFDLSVITCLPRTLIRWGVDTNDVFCSS